MKKKELKWHGNDGMMCYGTVYEPESKRDIQGTISIIHGLGEHPGRYKHVAEFFTDNGFVVLTTDLRGHGRSEGKRGHAEGFNVFFHQLDRLLETSSKRFPGEKKFIYGHSMGGNIVISHLLMHHPRVLGVIASAPWLILPKEPPKSKLMLARVMGMIYGAYAESNGIDTAKLSRSEDVVKAYEEDKNVHDKISAKLFLKGTEYAAYAIKHAAKVDVPLLIMHGDADEITSPKGSQTFANRSNKEYVTHKIWKGLYHELHNEPEKMEVLNYVLGWMKHQLVQAKKV